MLCAEDELGLGARHAGIIVLEAARSRPPLGDRAQARSGSPTRPGAQRAAQSRRRARPLGVARELCRDPPRRSRSCCPATSTREHARARADRRSPIASAVRALHRARDRRRRVGPIAARAFAHGCVAVGMRPISNVVDVTNYVLFELGQPLHAFDLDAAGGRDDRRSPRVEGERLITLDGQDRALEGDDLVIRDGERPVAPGRRDGRPRHRGHDSDAAACCSRAPPSRPRGCADRAAARLHSEASHRFERGVDPELARVSLLRRAARLLCQRRAAGASRRRSMPIPASAPARDSGAAAARRA